MSIDRIPLSWTPQRHAERYCSPACGFGCTWAEYQTAVDDSAALAKQLGTGWKPHIWENLRWHWEVTLKTMRVGPDINYVLSGKGVLTGYHAYIYSEHPAGGIVWSGHAKTPTDAIAMALTRAHREIDQKAAMIADIVTAMDSNVKAKR